MMTPELGRREEGREVPITTSGTLQAVSAVQCEALSTSHLTQSESRADFYMNCISKIILVPPLMLMLIMSFDNL